MGQSQKAAERGLCAYCGCLDDLTTDHVIPRSLFRVAGDMVPDDAPRVRACKQCNGAIKSPDDVYLRDMLASDARLAQHPKTQALRRGPLVRHPEKSQYLRDSLRQKLSRTPSGLYIYEPVLPADRLREMFIRIVRGLMVAYEHYRLSSRTNFDVMRAMDAGAALAEADRWARDASGMVHAVQAGNGSVFWSVYYHSQSPGHEDLSMWWLRFYENAVYWVGTDMSNLSRGDF